MKRLYLILMILWPTFAHAQSWPVHDNIWLNDYANVLEVNAEVRIIRSLQALNEETGIQASVLTLYTRRGYENPGSLEDFSTTLFNHWGVGDPGKNDGILILVISEDRDMRIELGSGYPREFDREALDIISDSFLPAFQENRMADGIEAGTDAVIIHIARAFAAGDIPSGPGNRVGGSILGVGILVTLITLIFGRKISDRIRRCPQCGKRAIRRSRVTDKKASKTSPGSGRETTTCSNCDYHATRTYSISRISTRTSSSGSSFGGGRSSGGGASGRW